MSTSPHCRLLIHTARSGTENLAIDEALLETISMGHSPVLRFYRWSPATLSLGYFQSLRAREEHGASLSCPVVRRSSGGGAIVHDFEWTYAFVVPTADRVVQESELYDLFHQTLIEALAEFGVEARQVVSPTNPNAFLCFQRRALGDVVVDGQKIAGSAQRKRRHGLLQHGSILIRRSRYAPELPGLEDLATHPTKMADLQEKWLPLLARRLNLLFIPDELSDTERNVAQVIEQERFSSPLWTSRR